MTPIQSICPECLAKIAIGIDQVLDVGRDDGLNSLHTWCKHNNVAISLQVLPGGIGGHWIMQPAASESEAKQRVEIALAQAEAERIVTEYLMNKAPPGGTA